MPAPFLTLQSLILPPPLPALIALLIVSGAAAIARTPANFIAVLALTGAMVNSLAMSHLATLPALRVIAAALVASNFFWLKHRSLHRSGIKTKDYSRHERLALTAVAATLLLLTLAALGPVTDPDSLDYHLGVPLDWIRHNGITLQPHWLHARLTGLGEDLNMLGLAAGTDCLGAVLQVSGLLAVMAAIASCGKTLHDRVFGLLLALPPALLPLTTAQKPQLLPAAAVAIAMILTRSAASATDFALIFTCIAFAMACKVSFAVSGAIVIAFALFQARKQNKLGAAASWAALAFIVLLLPLLLRNWNLYHDPISPFLEGLNPHPDPEITTFAVWLADAGGPHTLHDAAAFLPHLLLPFGPGGIQTFLGIGLLALLFTTRAYAAGFAAVLVFTLWKGQMAPRFLLDAYFWCAAGAVAAPWSRLKTALLYGLTIQTVGVAAMALVAAIILFPGALTPALRERVMRRATYGYQQALWMDRVAPLNSTIMVDSRAYALFPRPFLIPACAGCGGESLLGLAGSQDLRQPGLVLFPRYPAEANLPPGCLARTIAGPETFTYATRSPFTASTSYQVVAARAECP